MVSTIRGSDNFDSLTSANQVHMWARFNGTGTIAYNDSFNAAALTDFGTGDYAVNMSTLASNGSYSVSWNYRFTSNFNSSMARNERAGNTSSTYYIKTSRDDGFADHPQIYVAVFNS